MKMKKQIILFTASVFILINLNAQRVYFCDSYTSTGEPIGSNTKVSCPADGGYIYFLYQNGSTNLSQGSYHIYVDKLSEETYLPFDVKAVEADPSKKWFAYDYNFRTAGDYRITIKNPALADMIREYLTLIPEQSTGSSYSGIFDDPESIFYYTYSTIEATVSVNASTGQTGGSFESFNIDREQGGRIFFKLSNGDKAVNTQSLNVFVEKMDTGGTAQAFDNKTYPVQNQNSAWTYFSFDFFEPGKFTLNVYSADMVFINSINITVNYKV
jgi:hypothetical protein